MTTMPIETATLLTAAWSDQDIVALLQCAKKIDAQIGDLVAVFCSESRLMPSARNPADPTKFPLAVGLNQLTRVAVEGMGLIPATAPPAWGKWQEWADAFVRKSPADQLGTIADYFAYTPWGKTGKPWPNAGKLYLANAASALTMLPDDPATVVFPVGSGAYAGNRGLDITGAVNGKPKGFITMGDLTVAMAYHKTQPLWAAMMARIDALPSGMRVSGTSEDYNGPFWSIVHKFVERGMPRRLAEQHAERIVSEEVMIEKRQCPRCRGPLMRRLMLKGPSKPPMGTQLYQYHCVRCGQQMQRAEIIPARPSQ